MITAIAGAFTEGHSIPLFDEDGDAIGGMEIRRQWTYKDGRPMVLCQAWLKDDPTSYRAQVLDLKEGSMVKLRAGKPLDPEASEPDQIDPDLQDINPSEATPMIEDKPQTPVHSTDTDEVIEFLFDYGHIDGGHHKMWVIDQAIRKLAGDRYEELVAAFCDGEDGPDTYVWDEGIAP